MIILPATKLGTMPYGPARVRSARKFPKVDDNIWIKEAYSKKDKYNNPWIRVRVDKVDDNYVFFVHGIAKSE